MPCPYLIKNRVKESPLSYKWLKVWAKRVWTFPSLLSLSFRHRSYAKGGERFENLADMNGATSKQQSRAYFAMDFERICEETGFSKPMVSYSNHRRIPKMTSMLWHQISCAFLRGRFFSNGMALLTHKEA